MKIATTFALIALMLAPSIVAAQDCGSKSASMSCASGTVFDDKAKACVPVSG